VSWTVPSQRSGAAGDEFAEVTRMESAATMEVRMFFLLFII
jgi:hypothetical protein